MLHFIDCNILWQINEEKNQQFTANPQSFTNKSTIIKNLQKIQDILTCQDVVYNLVFSELQAIQQSLNAGSMSVPACVRLHSVCRC